MYLYLTYISVVFVSEFLECFAGDNISGMGPLEKSSSMECNEACQFNTRITSTVKSVRLESLLTWYLTFFEFEKRQSHILINIPILAPTNWDIHKNRKFLSGCHRRDVLQICRYITDDCAEGQTISIYLTTGMGVADTFVAMVAKEDVNCSLKFLVNKENYIIVVIEFLDWFFGRSQCGDIKNEVNVMVREKIINICYEVEESIIRKLGKGELSVAVKARHNMQTVKITATSAKVSRNGKCGESEVICLYGEEVFCLTEECKCDGNVNCGVRNKYDEELSVCENYSTVSPGMVIVGLMIVFVTFCMMVALLKKLVPNREGTFIVKEDETLSEKDRATGEKDFQVNTRVLSDQMDMDEVDIDAIKGSIQKQVSNRGIAFRKAKSRKMI